MKRRVRKIANFFAFNLLFFALYLNFIHKDQSSVPVSDQAVQQKVAAFSEATAANNTELQTANTAKDASAAKADNAPLKLSIN